MDPVTLGFLIVGAIGIVLLLVALLVGEIGHLGGVDADGPFSFPALAAFFGSAGFIGAIPASLIGDHLPNGARVPIAAGIGVLVALPIAFGVVRLTAALVRMRTDPTLTETDLEGALGIVISSIPSNGFGEIRVRVHGQDLKYAARAQNPLPVGTPIYVTAALSPTAVEVVSTAPEL